MGALTTSASGVVVRCPACDQKNRVPYANLGTVGRCGDCSEALGQVAKPIEISAEASFDALVSASPLPVLVDFWAPWCGPCVMVAPELEKVAASEAGRLVVAKVDTDAVPALGARLEIRSIPTLALFASGREIDRVMGARPAGGILEFVTQAGA